MSKKHFIELADVIREVRPNLDAKTGGPNDAYLDGRLAQWEIMRDRLATFCAGQNARFDRGRWLGYIAGTNGPNGGAKEKNPAAVEMGKLSGLKRAQEKTA